MKRGKLREREIMGKKRERERKGEIHINLVRKILKLRKKVKKMIS